MIISLIVNIFLHYTSSLLEPKWLCGSFIRGGSRSERYTCKISLLFSKNPGHSRHLISILEHDSKTTLAGSYQYMAGQKEKNTSTRTLRWVLTYVRKGPLNLHQCHKSRYLLGGSFSAPPWTRQSPCDSIEGQEVRPSV